MKVKEMELRHPLPLRLFHWANMISITILTLTGFYIHAPLDFPIFSSMDNARFFHFFFAMVLCVGVVGRVYYAIAEKDYVNVWPNLKKDIKDFPSMIAYYTFFADSHPDYGKYNPGQKMMYSGWLFLALIQIFTGFILYSPNSGWGWAMWSANFLGGFIWIRMIHLIVTWLFVITVMMHVYLDLSEGIPVLMSMFTGKIPKGFHHTEEHEAEA
ncbi:MAG: Ni/Fe-hydrogenase, b-type cytochrome subunit [Candidatus Saccharibacteria bacterium]